MLVMTSSRDGSIGVRLMALLEADLGQSSRNLGAKRGLCVQRMVPTFRPLANLLQYYHRALGPKVVCLRSLPDIALVWPCIPQRARSKDP